MTTGPSSRTPPPCLVLLSSHPSASATPSGSKGASGSKTSAGPKPTGSSPSDSGSSPSSTPSDIGGAVAFGVSVFGVIGSMVAMLVRKHAGPGAGGAEWNEAGLLAPSRVLAETGVKGSRPSEAGTLLPLLIARCNGLAHSVSLGRRVSWRVRMRITLVHFRNDDALGLGMPFDDDRRSREVPWSIGASARKMKGSDRTKDMKTPVAATEAMVSGSSQSSLK
ncbi:hypothetical protein B0H19DRAFT_1083196 [Mycena capillaripes]|nr:hypothetical protein B0H19DRAFT_1083196 [Mycena capillaripes]